MTENELINEYFEWMYQLVCDDKRVRRKSYRRLLQYLHTIDFTYSEYMDLDGNRADDGINLRYRFGYERNYMDPMVASYLDNRNCSVLEMLIALAVRCEEHIMGDSEIGNQTGKWFWDMIINLGLYPMIDKDFDKGYIIMVINRFLNREYERDGTGGLFTIKNCQKDLRDVEIWYQMCWHLSNFT